MVEHFAKFGRNFEKPSRFCEMVLWGVVRARGENYLYEALVVPSPYNYAYRYNCTWVGTCTCTRGTRVPVCIPTCQQSQTLKLRRTPIFYAYVRQYGHKGILAAWTLKYPAVPACYTPSSAIIWGRGPKFCRRGWGAKGEKKKLLYKLYYYYCNIIIIIIIIINNNNNSLSRFRQRTIRTSSYSVWHTGTYV